EHICLYTKPRRSSRAGRSHCPPVARQHTQRPPGHHGPTHSATPARPGQTVPSPNPAHLAWPSVYHAPADGTGTEVLGETTSGEGGEGPALDNTCPTCGRVCPVDRMPHGECAGWEAAWEPGESAQRQAAHA